MIELKRELPEPRKAARQIAALCNAAPGEDAAWVVGVGEDGTFALPNEELANWLPQVSRDLDGAAPTCRVYNFNIEGKPLVLLHFHTVLRPFVAIRENGDREISWRAGNLTRSATRSELLSLLVPTITRPRFEIVQAHITLERQSNFLNVGMEIYIIPTTVFDSRCPFINAKFVWSRGAGLSLFRHRLFHGLNRLVIPQTHHCS